MLYFDANVFHYLRDALAGRKLPDDVRAKILLSPISAIEVLSQLTVQQAEKVLESLHTMRTWLPERAGLLDWPDTFIAMAVFAIRLDDGFFDRMQKALNICLVSDSVDALREDAQRLKQLVDQVKDGKAKERQQFLEKYRTRTFSLSELKAAFAQVATARAHAKPGQRSEEEIVGALSAHFEYENRILWKAAANKGYNFLSHKNDILDSEQLVYLADPKLHFLTCDTGFRSVEDSEQKARIHVVKPDELTDAEKATAVLTRLG